MCDGINNACTEYKDDTERIVVEYLAEYLCYTLDKDNAKSTAFALLRKYGSLGVIAGASVGELMLVCGMTEASALSLKLLSSVYARSITDGFKFGIKHSEREICDYLRALCFGLCVETVFALFIDKDGKIMKCEPIGDGVVNYSEIHLRRLVEFASIYGASEVIVAHNHPKGRAVASSQDMVATMKIRDVLCSIGALLRAHYVVSDTECKRVAN